MAKKTKKQRDARKAQKKKRGKKRAPSPPSPTPRNEEAVEEPAEADVAVQEYPESEGRGMVSTMRGLARGELQQNSNPNFLTRRRTLGEWAIIFGVIGGAYYLVSRFLL